MTCAKVGIVGAGVVGLSVALKLKENFSSAVDVTIIAENYFQGTTSFGSGGFWEPYAIAGTDLKMRLLQSQFHIVHILSIRHVGRGYQSLGPNCFRSFQRRAS